MVEVSASQATELKKFEQKIVHSPEVVEHMSGVIIVGVTGPSASGTTTLSKHSGIYKVPGFTSRPPRYEGESEIRFYEHTTEFIDECIDRSRSGDLVQIRLSDEGYIYGSETVDYKRDELNVVDMVASSILGLYDLPIKELRPIVVVCDPDQWEQRFLRDRGSFLVMKERIWNDVKSLQIVVAQDNGEHAFSIVVNNDGELDRALKQFSSFAQGTVPVDFSETYSAAYDIRDALLGRMALVAS